MPATALAAAAAAQVVLRRENEVAFGRVVKIAGLKGLGNGSGHGGIKGKGNGCCKNSKRYLATVNFKLFLMKTPFAFALLAGVALGQPRPAAAQAPVVLTAATAPAGVRPALARYETALADPMREALRTLPQAKKRFLAGLPEGDQFLLSVRVAATDTSFRQVSARVLGWHGTTVQALLLPDNAGAAGPAEPLPVSFSETAVLDWTLLRASGREEGNYVGRYTDTARQLERLPLR